ncbi:MAG: hypothetical protein WEE64_09200 [Dehalococcoidia bacterium]
MIVNVKRFGLITLVAASVGLLGSVGSAAQVTPEPHTVVWVREGFETRVEIANIPLPDCLPDVAGQLWSPPMFLLPWTDFHEGPLPWISNHGTSYMNFAGFQNGGDDVLVHLHVIWNTTTGPNAEVLPDLSGGRILAHFMAHSDHDPLCEVMAPPFIREVRPLIGDVDHDGVVSVFDIATAVQHFGEAD